MLDSQLDEFLELAEGALADSPPALDRLVEGEAACGGALPPQWADRPRVDDAEARLRATACQVFARSAGLLTGAGRHSDAARRYARLLDLQPAEWGWHLQLMRAFPDAGEHRKAAAPVPAPQGLAVGARRERGPSRGRATL
jgi:hypothetical protein